MKAARQNLICAWAVAGIAAATRLPLLANRPLEPDSALFVIAAWQWIRFGPVLPAGLHVYTPHYYALFSSGYLWLIAHAAEWMRVAPAKLPLLMNGLSAGCAIATAPLWYALGRRWLSNQAAAMAAALLLLSPGLWILGLESHAEGPALACLAAALFLELRALEAARFAFAILGWVITAAALIAALLMRSDVVLYFPFMLLFPGAWRLWRQPHAWPWRQKHFWRDSGMAAGCALSAGSGYLWIRSLILRLPVMATQQHSLRTVENFIGYINPAVQVTPWITASGAGIFAFCAAGIYWARKNRETKIHARFWVWLIAAWCLPAMIFWFGIVGNVVRHVALLALPLIWLGCAGWERRGFRALYMAGALALGLNWIVIPPNSNLTLYPSGDVPASIARMDHRQRQLAKLAQKLADQMPVQAHASTPGNLPHPPYPFCFLGAFPRAYLLDDWMSMAGTYSRQAGMQILSRNALEQFVWLPAGSGQWRIINLDEVFAPGQFRPAAGKCDRLVSLEYNARGQRRRFFGRRVVLPRGIRFWHW